MLLTLTLNRFPATDLGYLLHKHPAKVQQVDIKAGVAHIFYPEVTDARTTCAMLLDIDPVALVRNDNPRGDAFALEQYVNDRPYVSSSFMSTAIAKSFASALNGRCKDKPELVDVPLPLEAHIAVMSVRGGAETLERLFGPLGYEIEAVQHPLDTQFPEWGMSRYYTVTLRGNLTLQALLSHLFILLPVLDGDKHYWVNKEEVAKLLEKGKGWLEVHPEKEFITRRYLRWQKNLADNALTALNRADDAVTESEVDETETSPVSQPKQERMPRLHDARLQAVCDALVASGATSVIDLGCGEGKLLKLLWPKSQFRKLSGMDVSTHCLEIAADKLHLQRFSGTDTPRLTLFQGSLLYADTRLKGYDAAALVEVIEHLEEDRLQTAVQVVFGNAMPATVIVTTPNKEWNQVFGENEERMRHTDHRFEWTRAQFAEWCEAICKQYDYECSISPLGEEVADWGAPTQMGLFKKRIQPLTN